MRRSGRAAKRSFGMNSETYRTVNAAKKLQIALAVTLPPKSRADMAAVADE